jgi:hypothetical protein
LSLARRRWRRRKSSNDTPRAVHHVLAQNGRRKLAPGRPSRSGAQRQDRASQGSLRRRRVLLDNRRARRRGFRGPRTAPSASDPYAVRQSTRGLRVCGGGAGVLRTSSGLTTRFSEANPALSRAQRPAPGDTRLHPHTRRPQTAHGPMITHPSAGDRGEGGLPQPRGPCNRATGSDGVRVARLHIWTGGRDTPPLPHPLTRG